MINFLKIESIKLIKSKKNRLIFVLFLIFLFGIVLYNTYMDKHYVKTMIQEMKDEKNYASDQLTVLNYILQESDSIPPDTEDKKSFWDKEKINSLLLEYYFKEYEDQTDWKQYITLTNEKYRNLLYGYEKGYINVSLLKARNQAPEQLKEYIKLGDYQLEHDKAQDPNPYRLTGVNFLMILLEGYMPIILLVFPVLFSLDLFQAEFEEGSYKLSFTQPYSRSKLFLYRILSSQLLQTGVFMGTILFFFLVLGIMNGFGDASAPDILFANGLAFPFGKTMKTGDILIASSLRYILLGYLLLFVVMALYSLLAIYITFITNSSSGAIGVITGIFIISIGLKTFLDKNSILQLMNPLSYMHISEVVKNRIHTWYLLGVTESIALIVLVVIRSYKKFCSMDMQGGN